MKRLLFILALVLSGCDTEIPTKTETYLKCVDGAGQVIYDGIVPGQIYSDERGHSFWTAFRARVWICDSAILERKHYAHE